MSEFRICKLIFYGLAVGYFYSLPTALAAKPASHCTYDAAKDHAEIEGLDIHERLPIGSVSKLVTTYWALATQKPTDRYQTRIFITPVIDEKSKQGQSVDLHFQGSRDPYFGKLALHVLISELNKLKIYKVRNISFDENFKFFWNAAGGPMLGRKRLKVETGYYGPDSPTPEEVAIELGRYRSNLAYDYSASRNYLTKFNYTMPESARLSAAKIHYLPSQSFKAADNSIVRNIFSSPLIMLLREMNRNSNNHAANQIFESLGGESKFKDFIMQNNLLFEKDILMINGHGNRKDLPEGGFIYNEASCVAIMKVIIALRNKLTELGKDLDDVLPVPGADAESTLDAYDNKSYSEALAAKTGTIGPAVTLAGMLQTHKGPVYFMYNMSTQGSLRDWRRARTAIGKELTLLTQQYSGAAKIDAQNFKFLSFDPALSFHEEAESNEYSLITR